LNQNDTTAGSARELRVAAEITQAFLHAERPTEVYRLALERVAPLIGAAFACIFLREGDSDLLRIVSVYNWPQKYATYLGSMRVRIGNGPTGRAVLENRLIDVTDLFADPELEDWWEAARELGFNSAIALPLSFQSRPVGAVTFYFRDSEVFQSIDRELLRLVANQLAATAEKAHLIDDLQRANDRLIEQNVALQQRTLEAEEARRAKNEFLANVSHELRTPLTTIMGYTFLIKEGVTGKLLPEQAMAISKVEGAGGQLMSLIDGLLELTNLRLGHGHAEPELCDAAALARTAIINLGSPPPEIQMKMDIPADRVPVHTDPQIVLRVLNTLLCNALKFTPHGTVTLGLKLVDPEPDPDSAFAPAPEVIWEVVDTGIGIEPNLHGAIFHEFHQADGSATRRFGGMGIGLAIARGLARRLGGDIHVESDLGQGARFSFAIPSAVVRAGAV
jgi:signal transduction histidine kinase